MKIHYFTSSACLICLLVCMIGAASLPAQTEPAWQTLSNAPDGPRRFNDLYFVSPDTGWIVNGAGQIYHTSDGGDSWELQFEKSNAHFRSVGFFDAQNGWAGNVGLGEFGTTDTTALYQTSDGGATWLPMNDFIGDRPTGLCGMFVLDDTTIFAVGRVRGPAYFAKTTDRGETWLGKDMAALAPGLIDVHFFDPDTGFAVGLTNADHNSSRGIVLSTTDGGETWRRQHITDRTGEWCWKLSFPTRQTGYASLQRNTQSPVYFLKTTDGGATWQEKFFFQTNYFVQGIGFVDELNGWIGGNSSYPSYVTSDGGETWAPAGFGTRMNRVRFLSDTLGYAVGQTVYKYSRSTPVPVLVDGATPQAFALAQNYPNPFNPHTAIEFSLPQAGQVRLAVYDMAGREIAVLVQERLSAGGHRVTWQGTDHDGRAAASGVYFYRLQAESPAQRFSQARKMLLLR